MSGGRRSFARSCRRSVQPCGVYRGTRWDDTGWFLARRPLQCLQRAREASVKLRIQDNSLRFRLTQREVMRLKENGRVEAEVRLTADRALYYSVTSTQAIAN